MFLSGSTGSSESSGLFGVGVGFTVGVGFRYSFIIEDICGKNITTKTKIVKIIKMPIEVFLLLSNSPI